MPQNDRTSGAGTPKALENVCFPADSSRDTAHAHHLQAFRIRQRFSFSPALAAAVADLAFALPENRGRA